MSEFRSAWNDPNVKAALKQRRPTDIALIECCACGNYGYFNEGSHFSCSVEGCEFSISGEEIDRLIENGEVVTLDEYSDMEAMSEDVP
jgi:hypothetical protein